MPWAPGNIMVTPSAAVSTHSFPASDPPQTSRTQIIDELPVTCLLHGQNSTHHNHTLPSPHHQEEIQGTGHSGPLQTTGPPSHVQDWTSRAGPAACRTPDRGAHPDESYTLIAPCALDRTPSAKEQTQQYSAQTTKRKGSEDTALPSPPPKAVGGRGCMPLGSL